MSDPVVLNGGEIGQKGMVTKFINHVFDFGDESKKDLMNLVQFSVLAIVPLILSRIIIFIDSCIKIKGALVFTLKH